MSVVKEKREIIVIAATASIGFLFYYFTGFHPVVCVMLFGFIMGISVSVVHVTRRMSKKWGLIISAVWFSFLALLFLNPASLVVIGMSIQVTQSERYICKPDVYTPSGETLALYCQSYPLLQPLLPTNYYDQTYIDGAWIPEKLNIIHHGAHGTIQKDSAYIEMGGGFHHYGYRLSLDTQASSAGTNVWQLFMYREESPDRHLLTIHMDATRRLTTDELRLRIRMDG